MARKLTTPQKRAQLFLAGGEPVTDSVWVEVPRAGAFTLLHDYPGVAPAPGWRVACEDRIYTVKTVAGRTLHCEAEQ